MKNPYEVLGISENASEDEIRTAYRELAKKYSSENFEGSASEAAMRKMNEINEAYDTIIMSGSAARKSGREAQGASSGGRRSTYQGQNSHYASIRSKIRCGQIEDAAVLLDGMPESTRNAEWYYLKGSIHQRRGWLEEAEKNFSTAVSMDPGNQEYRAAYNRMNANRGDGYRRERKNRSECGACEICTGLICLDCCCDCAGGNSC